MQLNQFDFIEINIPGYKTIKDCYFFEDYTDKYFIGISQYKESKFVSVFITEKKYIKKKIKSRGRFLIIEKEYSDSIFLFDSKFNIILLHKEIYERIDRVFLVGNLDFLFIKPTFFNKLKYKLKSILKYL